MLEDIDAVLSIIASLASLLVIAAIIWDRRKNGHKAPEGKALQQSTHSGQSKSKKSILNTWRLVALIMAVSILSSFFAEIYSPDTFHNAIILIGSWTIVFIIIIYYSIGALKKLFIVGYGGGIASVILTVSGVHYQITNTILLISWCFAFVIAIIGSIISPPK